MTIKLVLFLSVVCLFCLLFCLFAFLFVFLSKDKLRKEIFVVVFICFSYLERGKKDVII